MTTRMADLSRKVLAVLVLAVVAWVLFKVVLGVVTALAWVLAAIVAVVALIWAVSTLRR